MLRNILLFLFALLSLSVFAQSKHCIFDQHLQQQLSQNREYKEKLENLEKSIRTFQNQKADSIIRIPVVFHIVYRTAAQNISNKQIISQLEVLNEDFRLLNADTAMVDPAFPKGDVKIEFCFAGLDTNGQAFSGVTRKQTQSYQVGKNSAELFAQQPVWDSRKYLNIYVCELGQGDAGYSSFPGWNPAQDAVVIDYSNFGVQSADKNYALGRTATHEVGHWLGLYHIWGINQAACNDDDQVTDTPNQGVVYNGCPLGKKFSCGSQDMTSNYMGYVYDRCMAAFTPGQGSRMRNMIATARPMISSSIPCSSDPILPERDRIVYQVHLFPNPVKEKFFVVQEGSSFSAADFSLYSIQGKEIPIDVQVTGSAAEIRIKTQRSGIFFLKFKTAEGEMVKKVALGLTK